MIPATFAPFVSHLWQSTLFATVAGLLTLALRRNQARVRYWVWLAASYKFLFPFSWLVSLGHAFQWHAASLALPSVFLSNISTERPSPDHLLAAMLIVWAIWACGAAVVLVGWAKEWLRVRAIARSASTVKLGLTIPVLLTAGRLEPGVFGIFRPVLLLPEGITARLTQTQLRFVLAHELSHVRRRDNLAAAVHMLVEALFWFHPLVWWLGDRLIDERERACDEEVLQAGAPAQVYAETILKVCEYCLAPPLTCVSGITGSEIKKRMERIMRNQKAEVLKTGKKLLLVAAGVTALLTPLAVGTMTVPSLSAQASGITVDGTETGGASVALDAAEGSFNAEQQNQIYQPGKDGVSYPTCIYCPDPKYSEQALKARLEGLVALQAVITARGRAAKVKVLKGPGLGLEEKAVEVLKQWRFKPAKAPNGTPVAVEVPIEVTFRLPTPKH